MSLWNVTGSQVRSPRPGSPDPPSGNPAALRVPWAPRLTPVFLSSRRMAWLGLSTHDRSSTPPEITRPWVSHGDVKVPWWVVVVPTLKRATLFVVTSPTVTLKAR
jgi:hypothetical protein